MDHFQSTATHYAKNLGQTASANLLTENSVVINPMSLNALILFVGSFKAAGQDGYVGGQMYACRSLLDSALAKKYDWLLLDSTAKSNIRVPFPVRIAHAAKRLVRFLKVITTRRVDCCIIFTSNGWSFVEKGTMAVVAKLLRKKVIIAPRSGFVAAARLAETTTDTLDQSGNSGSARMISANHLTQKDPKSHQRRVDSVLPRHINCFQCWCDCFF